MSALAISAAAAATASAAPEFLHLAAAPTLLGITGKAGATKMVDTTSGITIKCSKEVLEGEIEPAAHEKNVEEVFIKFTGCGGLVVLGGKGTKCSVNTPGRAPGTLRTKRLRGELGEVAFLEAPSEVGLDLVPEVGTVLERIEGPACGILNTPVEGSIIGEMTVKGPPESFTKTLLTTTAAGKQKIQNFVAALKDTLEAPTEATLTSKLTLKFEEEVEII